MSLAHRPDRKPPALFATVLQSCSLLFLRNMGHGHCGLALMALGRANIFRSSLNRPLHARHIAASYRTAGAATASPVMADSPPLLAGSGHLRNHPTLPANTTNAGVTIPTTLR